MRTLLVLSILCVGVLGATVCDVSTSMTLMKSEIQRYKCSESFVEGAAMSYSVTAAPNIVYQVLFTNGADCDKSQNILHFPTLSCISNKGMCEVFIGDASVGAAYESPTCLLIATSTGGQATVEVKYWPATFDNQFHLKNTGQWGPGTEGNDVNVEPVWADGNTGQGVAIDIVDDGLQANHLEFSNKLLMDMSWNYETNVNDPTGAFGARPDSHGTGCAGVAAAADNAVCGKGAAPDALLAGHRVLFSGLRLYQHADAIFSRASAGLHIGSNSYGPQGCDERGCTFYVEPPARPQALRDGVLAGRDGKGRVYVFAAGNEGHLGGDTNQYPLTKYGEVITVAGSAYDGRRVYYSNRGANLFVNAPTQGKSQLGQNGPLFPGIVTAHSLAALKTDRCRSNFGGTSSATPLVAGVVALVLSANPQLSWRDVQWILAQTAARNDPSSPTWARNGAGYWFSHWYGFGRVDAAAAVAAAKAWDVSVTGNYSTYLSAARVVNMAIPDNDAAGVSDSLAVSPGPPHESTGAPDFVENAIVLVNVTHQHVGDLAFTLVSPNGTRAFLTVPTTNHGPPLRNYPLSARAFFGEPSSGVWTLTVADESHFDRGTFDGWQLFLSGRGVPAPGGLGPQPGTSASLRAAPHLLTLLLAALLLFVIC